MHEHTIPKELIESIKSGKVALVVGSGLGIPSWKQLIESMNDELRSRGNDGDLAAAKDIDKLLHKSNFVRAASFLSRTLGPSACDAHVKKLWASPSPLPEVAEAIGKLPFLQVWTTFPGDILERAMEENLPDDWPSPRVLTYAHAQDINRERTVFKLLGDFESYVVTPTSIRQTLANSSALIDHIRSYYREGSLILIGFRYGDPDLAALLDRIFGALEPPIDRPQQHYMIASGVGPVTVDELRAEHHIELINLAGRGADEKATAALIELLGELSKRCQEEGISLVNTLPDADDLEGWLEMLAVDPLDAEAIGALSAIEERARTEKQWDALIEVLMARVELESSGTERAVLLRRVAEVFEDQIGDLPRAFTALTAALGEDPGDLSSVEEAERLAEETEGWTELVADVSAIADQIEDPEIAAQYWVRLGEWYHRKLDHLDYATTSYRQAVKLDDGCAKAHAGLARMYRIGQRWTELAEALARRFDLETDDTQRVEIALELGEIRENHLASISKSIVAYEKVLEIEADSDAALAALERLLRREERWGKLAATLEARAELFERQGESGRAKAARHELATLRLEKLGDIDGAIAKYEAAVDRNPDDANALSAVAELYEKTGRRSDSLRTLSRLADVLPIHEQTAVLRRLGTQWQDRPDELELAIQAYQRVLVIEPSASDAHQALAQLFRAEKRWPELADAITTHAGVLNDSSQRADAYEQLGAVYEEHENDPHRAIEAHLHALAEVSFHQSSLVALARLYERTEAWPQALEIIEQLASMDECSADRAKTLWERAGKLAATELDDRERAEQYLEKALELGGTVEALSLLAELHKRRENWASSTDRLIAAAELSKNRLERVELLGDAAELAAVRLEEPERAAHLCLEILKLDPENRAAGLRAATFLLREQEDEKALPIVEMLARTTEANDRRELARWQTELGSLRQRLGHLDKAVVHFRRAVDADSDNQRASMGLATALFAGVDETHDGEASGTDGINGTTGADGSSDVERWRAIDTAYRELLARHRTTLADGQVAEAWTRVGLASAALDEVAKARDAFARALEYEPTNLTALTAVVGIETRAGRWDRVAEAKRGMLSAAQGGQKISLLEEIGDLFADEVGDSKRALGAYLEAAQLAPTSHRLLHKILDIYTAQEDWRNAVETLDQIAGTASAAERRAAYFYAAGVIGRDKLKDLDLAAEYFGKAVSELPEHPKAFTALDTALERKGDYKTLARAYRRQLKQLVGSADDGLRLWTRLGDICSEHLGDFESAIAAYEVAVSLDPDNMDRHEQLANLYLDGGQGHRRGAISELQILLEKDPSRVELFKALFELYRAEGETDKAFCLAQALVFLGAAGADETGLFAQLRPRVFAPAKRHLTEEMWQKAILHNRESRHVNAIFSQVVGQLSATTAQPPSAFNLGDEALAGDQLAAKLTRYAAQILALDPLPAVYAMPGVGGVRVANTAKDGRLAPSVLLGDDSLNSDDERQLAFEVGKRLTYLRPDRFVSYSLGSLDKLESAFLATLAAAGVGEPSGGEMDRLATHLRKSVPRVVLEQISEVAAKMPGDPSNGLISSWRVATELTSSRVGFILCNDFEVAAHSMATESGGSSPLGAKARIQDLLAYAVSENYFTVRRHLGLSVV